jgi:hypothetical protein
MTKLLITKDIRNPSSTVVFDNKKPVKKSFDNSDSIYAAVKSNKPVKVIDSKETETSAKSTFDNDVDEINQKKPKDKKLKGKPKDFNDAELGNKFNNN